MLDSDLSAERQLEQRGELQQQLIGKQVEVILEQFDAETDYFKGRCEHYAEISLKSSGTTGDIIHATVTGLDGSKTLAKPALQIL